MKYKNLCLIAALSCAVMLMQTGCGSQAQSTALASNDGVSSTQSSTPSSNSSQGSDQTSTDQTGASTSSNPSSTTSSSTGSSSNSSSSSSTGASQTPPQTDSSGTQSLPPRSQWQLASKYYGIQGTVVSINQSDNILHSMTIKVNKNLKGGASSDGNPNHPFKIGSTAEFLFEQPLSDKGVLNPQDGDQVEMQVGQYVIPGHKYALWGSEFQFYYFEKDGKYYDYQGKPLPAE